MSDNCPQCGFKLKDFYKQKIEDELKSDFEKQKKDQFIELNKINYVNGIDPDGRIFVDFGVSGIPEKFFVTPEGQIVRKIIGPNTSKTLDDILTDMTDAALGIGNAR